MIEPTPEEVERMNALGRELAIIAHSRTLGQPAPSGVACLGAAFAFLTTLACVHKEEVGRPVDKVALAEVAAEWLAMAITHVHFTQIQ